MPAARLLLLLLALAGTAHAETPADLLARFDAYPHAVRMSFSEREVVDYEIGLGAMQKREGVWQFKRSERLSGLLTRYTWQITDGFAALDVLAELQGELDKSSRLLFSCDSRACGQGSPWANQVFNERLLYGRDEFQRYRVYAPADDTAGNYRVILFSAARLADRQYLHAELLRVGE